MSPHHEDELLTVAMAAALARRSQRTIRRAYRSGALVAYRDGNGHGVRIAYGDLRRWMMAATAAAPAQPDRDEDVQLIAPLKRLDMRGKARVEGPSENLALLNAAREQRQRGGAPRDAAAARAAGSAAASGP